MIRTPRSERASSPGVLKGEVEMQDPDFVYPREIVPMCQRAAAEICGRCSRSAVALTDDAFADRRSAHNLTRS
jgi:hypothetical protein